MTIGDIKVYALFSKQHGFLLKTKFKKLQMHANNDFEGYKKAAKQAQKLATHFYVLEVMRLNKVARISCLLKKLDAIEERADKTRQERNSNFWYRKFRMQPLEREGKFNDIDMYFPEVSWVLVHPLWKIATGTEVDNPEMQDNFNRLGKPKHLNFHTDDAKLLNIELFGRMNNFNGLFALLMLQKSISPESAIAETISRAAFNLFCRLMTLSYATSERTILALFEAIESSVYMHYLHEPKHAVKPMNAYKQLSIQCNAFGQQNDNHNVLQFIHGLKKLMTKLRKSWLKKSTMNDQHLFLAEALNTNIASLYDEIDARHQHSHFTQLNSIIEKVNTSSLS